MIMRWIPFILVLFAGLVIQTGVGRLVGLGPQRVMPDILLMLAVLLAFRGRGHSVLIACWILGLARDLTSDAVLGTYSFGFGMMGIGVMRVKELLYANRALTIVVLTFFCAFAVEQFSLGISIFKGALGSDRYGVITLAILFSSLFTAALSPYGQWLVMKMDHFLGLGAGESYR